MAFRSRIDTFFVHFITLVIFISWSAFFWPTMFFDDIDLTEFLLLLSGFLIGTSFIMWPAYSIRYEFYQDYLLVRGGPFVSKIPYGKITKVAFTKDIFSGYRVLSSRNAIEIFYKEAYWGSVKVSPEARKTFIDELKKHCPSLQIRE